MEQFTNQLTPTAPPVVFSPNLQNLADYQISFLVSTINFRMPDVRRGLIIVNTGPGKGKTTAALGTALRAVGNGMRVLVLQFLKGSWHYGELDAVLPFGDNFVLKQMGRGFVKVGGAETDPEDIRLVHEAWNEAK